MPNPNTEKLSMASLKARFLEVFGALFPADAWSTAKLNRLLDSMQFRELDAGARILREGQVCINVPFVMSGSIRVHKTGASGREITLYRIEKGQTCILSAGCGAGIASFPASVVAETATTAAFMPNEAVRGLLAENAAFRDFVFNQYSQRMAEVIELVEEVAFRHIDERLRLWLAEADSGSPDRPIAATHQEIADHLGTSREVVSRILKDWEHQGILTISRGAIILLPDFKKFAV